MVTDKPERSLSEIYTEFREVLSIIPLVIEPMPYGWTHTQETHDLHPEHSMDFFLYCETASDAARDMSNSVNDLILRTQRLQAWERVFFDCREPEQKSIVREFLQPETTISLNLPYCVKARFFYHIAHVSHQANRFLNPIAWSDKETDLPNDREILEKIAHEKAKHWIKKRKLFSALNKLDGQSFKQKTNDFRNCYTHRHNCYVEQGLAKSIHRKIRAGKTQYVIGGSNNLPFSRVVEAMKSECLAAEKSFERFKLLVLEQQSSVREEFRTTSS